MLHIEDTVPVFQSWDSQKCFCKLQRLQNPLSIFFSMKCNRNILFGNGKKLKYIQEKNEIDYDLNLEVSKSTFFPH